MIIPSNSSDDTSSSLAASLDNLRRQEQHLIKDLDNANKDRLEIMRKRAQTYRDLARIHLDDALSDGIISDADKVEATVGIFLTEHSQEMAALKERIQVIEKAQNDAKQKQEDAQKEIAQLEESLATLSRQVQEQLQQDDTYKTLKARYDEMQSIYEQVDQKVKQTEKDRAEKGTSYENDPLFMYLWRRQYGASGYGPINLIRLLDSKIADLVNYNAMRANYAILIEIPERMRQHLGNVAAKRDAEKSNLENYCAEKIKTLASRDLYEDLEEARDREKTQIKALEGGHSELSSVSAQINNYAQGQDSAFKKAIETTIDFMQGQKISDLMERARQTPNPMDDPLVQNLNRFERDEKVLDKTIADYKSKLNEIVKRKEEITERQKQMRPVYRNENANFGEGNEFWIALLKIALQIAFKSMGGHGSSGSSGRSSSSSSSGSDGSGFRTGGGF